MSDGDKRDGGPAFPCPGTPGQEDHSGRNWIVFPAEAQTGMTLRDWVAVKAMAGMLARDTGVSARMLAGAAYDLADAMIAERERRR